MRPIDADALMAQVIRKVPGPANKRYTEGFNDALMKFRSMISTAPTIEVKELVHCKDCGWAEKCGDKYECMHNHGLVELLNGNDFCSYGEVKE